MTPEQDQIRQRLGANLPCQFVDTDWGWGLVSTNGTWACVQESEDVFNVYQFSNVYFSEERFGVMLEILKTRTTAKYFQASPFWTLLPEVNL